MPKGGNRKGSGRKSLSPDLKKEKLAPVSFNPEPEVLALLKSSNCGFKSRSALINFALKAFYQVYENPNDD